MVRLHSKIEVVKTFEYYRDNRVVWVSFNFCTVSLYKVPKSMCKVSSAHSNLFTANKKGQKIVVSLK